MSEEHFLNENAEIEQQPPQQSQRESRLVEIWEALSRAGLAEATLRLGTHVLLIALILGIFDILLYQGLYFLFRTL